MGDIGCYTLGALPPLQAIDTVVCMGASIGMAHGMEKAIGRESSQKTVAVIGDSTFFHSGITGLVNIVYNSGCSTVMILDNSTTGMTGHQEHPGTGKNIRREPAPAIDLTAIVKAVGIEDVTTVDPFDLIGLEKALKSALANDAPSVIITKRPCALLSKTISEPYFIDEDQCKKCGMCLKLGCPAIENKEGKIAINYALCNGCGLCTNVCKFNAIHKGAK
jgi:indolepyruvate ferredoxin oxidoreductase alpha subunit